MAIRLFFSNLIETTYSPLQQPREPSDVVSNTFKFSTWISHGAGAITLLSVVFSKYATHETAKALIPYVIKASFGISLASTMIAAYIGYNKFHEQDYLHPQGKKDFYKKLNQKALCLELRVYQIGALGTIAALVAQILLKTNPTINWMASRSMQPLFWMGITGLVIWIFNTFSYSSYLKTLKQENTL